MSATSYVVKTPHPIFRRNLRLAPAHPIDDRILVRENKPATVTEAGVDIPETADDRRAMNGILIAVGDAAADYLYDRGIELGDAILYAKYAGVVSEWQFIAGPDDLKCAHEGVWDHVPRPSAIRAALSGKDPAAVALARKWATVGGPNENIDMRECRACGTLKATERHIVMSCKDILMSVDLQERIERGEMIRYRGKDPEGKPRFYIERLTKRPDCYGGVEPSNDIPIEMKEVA